MTLLSRTVSAPSSSPLLLSCCPPSPEQDSRSGGKVRESSTQQTRRKPRLVSIGHQPSFGGPCSAPTPKKSCQMDAGEGHPTGGTRNEFDRGDGKEIARAAPT